LATDRVEQNEFRFAVYPRRSGHGPELDDPQALRWLGRFIGRLHAVGRTATFSARRTMDNDTFGHQRLQILLDTRAIPIEQLETYRRACESALASVDAAFASADNVPNCRLHGDFHPGNILWRDEGPHIVDLDDCCNGPAIQDLWMLLSGSRESMRAQLGLLLEGYSQFASFDRRELQLIEPLRTLRMIHHSAWLAERWSDPAFPVAFPWFDSPNYWLQQTQQLREQLDAMAEPPLQLG
jgi:Ser/Thr protein kinase RdoA (MazF antagonist)